MSVMVNGIEPNLVGQADNKQIVSPGDGQTKFAETLKAAVENVNDTQNASDQQTKRLSGGNIDDLHNVMIAGQKASITLETTVQVQRKVVDAYNEMMRMQV